MEESECNQNRNQTPYCRLQSPICYGLCLFPQDLLIYFCSWPTMSLLLSEHAKCLSVGVFDVAVPSASTSLHPLQGVLVIGILNYGVLGSEAILPSLPCDAGAGDLMPQLCRTSSATEPLLASAIRGHLRGVGRWDSSSGSLTFPVSNAIFPFDTATRTFLPLWHSQTRLYKAFLLFLSPRLWQSHPLLSQN